VNLGPLKFWICTVIWLSGIKQEIQFPGESQDIGNFSGFASGLYNWQGMCVGSMVSWQTCKFCLLQLSVFLNGASWTDNMVRNCNVSIDILTTYIVLWILVFLNQDDDELHEETEEYLDGTQIAPKESLQGFGGWSARTRFATLSQQYPVFQLSFFSLCYPFMCKCGSWMDSSAGL
jgi:hypothetical protein